MNTKLNEQHFLEIVFFCDNVKHFIVTFDQFNAFLLKKCVHLFEVKTLLTLHF